MDQLRGSGRKMACAVAIPARNEEERIGPCLRALIHDAERAPDHVVVMVNNTTDATASIARSMQSGITRVHTVQRRLPPARANAGTARRIAMDIAADLAGESGVLLTTDADGRVDPSWLAANLAVLAGGVDLAAGWVELEPSEWGAIPLRLHEDDARECEYDWLCDCIHDRLDPDPFDPLPRHTQASGASLGMTVAAYRRCGGLPAVASGEDRALLRAMRHVDARVRHAPEIRVEVSGRLAGRAVGGMAETIARRMVRPDLFLDDRLEMVATVVRWARARALARHVFDGGDATALAKTLALGPLVVVRAMQEGYFGAAWDKLERSSPVLAPRPVAVADLSHQVSLARAFLALPTAPFGQAEQLA